MKKSKRSKGTGVERRKHPRSLKKAAKGPIQAKKASRPLPEVNTEECAHCAKDLNQAARALYVEEEVGRIFCSEDCISSYFHPEIERLEKKYHNLLSPSDLSGEERDSLNHLRWVTLQEPDEIWREKTVTGDYRYTLISEFQPSARKIWYVCICLFLKGEPSFLFLGFPSRSAAMVGHYRKGERVEWAKATGKDPGQKGPKKQVTSNSTAPQSASESPTDRLADEWTEDETIRAEQIASRRADDIDPSLFDQFGKEAQQTLDEPSELWIYRQDEISPVVYQFIKHYPDSSAADVEKEPFWYVIIAKEVEGEEHIEVLDAFPTRDIEMVNRYRRGEQEIGAPEDNTSRVVH